MLIIDQYLEPISEATNRNNKKRKKREYFEKKNSFFLSIYLYSTYESNVDKSLRKKDMFGKYFLY